MKYILTEREYREHRQQEISTLRSRANRLENIARPNGCIYNDAPSEEKFSYCDNCVLAEKPRFLDENPALQQGWLCSKNQKFSDKYLERKGV